MKKIIKLGILILFLIIFSSFVSAYYYCSDNTDCYSVGRGAGDTSECEKEDSDYYLWHYICEFGYCNSDYPQIRELLSGANRCCDTSDCPGEDYGGTWGVCQSDGYNFQAYSCKDELYYSAGDKIDLNEYFVCNSDLINLRDNDPYGCCSNSACNMENICNDQTQDGFGKYELKKYSGICGTFEDSLTCDYSTNYVECCNNQNCIKENVESATCDSFYHQCDNIFCRENYYDCNEDMSDGCECEDGCDGSRCETTIACDDFDNNIVTCQSHQENNYCFWCGENYGKCENSINDCENCGSDGESPCYGNTCKGGRTVQSNGLCGYGAEPISPIEEIGCKSNEDCKPGERCFEEDWQCHPENIENWLCKESDWPDRICDKEKGKCYDNLDYNNPNVKSDCIGSYNVEDKCGCLNENENFIWEGCEEFTHVMEYSCIDDDCVGQTPVECEESGVCENGKCGEKTKPADTPKFEYVAKFTAGEYAGQEFYMDKDFDDLKKGLTEFDYDFKTGLTKRDYYFNFLIKKDGTAQFYLGKNYEKNRLELYDFNFNMVGFIEFEALVPQYTDNLNGKKILNLDNAGIGNINAITDYSSIQLEDINLPLIEIKSFREIKYLSSFSFNLHSELGSFLKIECDNCITLKLYGGDEALNIRFTPYSKIKPDAFSFGLDISKWSFKPGKNNVKIRAVDYAGNEFEKNIEVDLPGDVITHCWSGDKTECTEFIRHGETINLPTTTNSYIDYTTNWINKLNELVVIPIENVEKVVLYNDPVWEGYCQAFGTNPIQINKPCFDLASANEFIGLVIHEFGHVIDQQDKEGHEFWEEMHDVMCDPQSGEYITCKNKAVFLLTDSNFEEYPWYMEYAGHPWDAASELHSSAFRAFIEHPKILIKVIEALKGNDKSHAENLKDDDGQNYWDKNQLLAEHGLKQRILDVYEQKNQKKTIEQLIEIWQWLRDNRFGGKVFVAEDPFSKKENGFEYIAEIKGNKYYVYSDYESKLIDLSDFILYDNNGKGVCEIYYNGAGNHYDINCLDGSFYLLEATYGSKYFQVVDLTGIIIDIDANDAGRIYKLTDISLDNNEDPEFSFRDPSHRLYKLDENKYATRIYGSTNEFGTILEVKLNDESYHYNTNTFVLNGKGFESVIEDLKEENTIELTIKDIFGNSVTKSLTINAGCIWHEDCEENEACENGKCVECEEPSDTALGKAAQWLGKTVGVVIICPTEEELSQEEIDKIVEELLEDEKVKEFVDIYGSKGEELIKLVIIGFVKIEINNVQDILGFLDIIMTDNIPVGIRNELEDLPVALEALYEKGKKGKEALELLTKIRELDSGGSVYIALEGILKGGITDDEIILDLLSKVDSCASSSLGSIIKAGMVNADDIANLITRVKGAAGSGGDFACDSLKEIFEAGITNTEDIVDLITKVGNVAGDYRMYAYISLRGILKGDVTDTDEIVKLLNDVKTIAGDGITRSAYLSLGLILGKGDTKPDDVIELFTRIVELSGEDREYHKDKTYSFSILDYLTYGGLTNPDDILRLFTKLAEDKVYRELSILFEYRRIKFNPDEIVDDIIDLLTTLDSKGGLATYWWNVLRPIHFAGAETISEIINFLDIFEQYYGDDASAEHNSLFKLPEVLEKYKDKEEKKIQDISSFARGYAILTRYSSGMFYYIGDLKPDLSIIEDRSTMINSITSEINNVMLSDPSKSNQISVLINTLHDNDESDDLIRKTIAQNLDLRSVYYLISIGGTDLYTSTFEKLYYYNLMQGEGYPTPRFSDWLSEIKNNIDPNEEHTLDFVLTLSNYNKLKDVMDQDPDFLLNSIKSAMHEEDNDKLIENGIKLISTIQEIFTDNSLHSFKTEIENFLISSYDTNLDNHIKKTIFAYNIKLNKDYFSEKNKQRAIEISDSFVEILEPTIPEEWLEDNILTAKLYFTQKKWLPTTRDKFFGNGATNEDGTLKGFFEFKEIDYFPKDKPYREAHTFVLEPNPASKLLDGRDNGLFNGVKLRVILTTKLDDLASEINNQETDIISHRGHSFSERDDFIPKIPDSDIKKLIQLGGCGGFGRVAGVQKKLPYGYFQSDENTGEGAASSRILFYIMRSIALRKDQDLITWDQVEEDVITSYELKGKYPSGIVFPHRKELLLNPFIRAAVRDTTAGIINAPE